MIISINGVESARFAGTNTGNLGDHIPGVVSEGGCPRRRVSWNF